MARRSKPRSGTPPAKSASALSPPPTTEALLVLSSSTISLVRLLSIASSGGSMNSRSAFGMFIPDACMDKTKKKGWNLWIDAGKNVVRRKNIEAVVRRVMDGGNDDREG
ncbi:unnamed protein product [Camellia sinensis]